VIHPIGCIQVDSCLDASKPAAMSPLGSNAAPSSLLPPLLQIPVKAQDGMAHLRLLMLPWSGVSEMQRHASNHARFFAMGPVF
jgi:hypothetical protein